MANNPQGTPSPYFEISRYTTEEPDEHPETGETHGPKLTQGTEQICFMLKNGEPEKLGDGSFGAVYRGQDSRNEEVAIKLLYDNISIRPRQLSELSREELDLLIKPLATKHNLNDVDNITNVIVENRDEPFQLIQKLEKEFATDQGGNHGEHNKVNWVSFLNDLTKQISSSAVRRFEKERAVYNQLLASVARKSEGREWDVQGVVKILGGTHNFHSKLKSDLQEIEGYLIKEEINISNYVLVMDRYSYSLKDLLEVPLPDREKSGYEILASQSHSIRVREALLILKGVADGLEQLHNVVNAAGHPESFFHRDIKPGNIFIKQFRDRFEVALGDLGTLNDLSSSAKNSSPQGSLVPNSLDDDFAPGTQHYRSPEQKYYKDVADAQVKYIPSDNVEERVNRILEEKGQEDNKSDEGSNASSDQVVVLIIQDPKFKNTLIEPEDIVILSKDTDRRPLLIAKIIPTNPDRDRDNSIQPFVCQLAVEASLVKQDEKTQVEFYKKQSYRTDLFGIGAVAFDMITVGQSPEKFYESIRKYETYSVKEMLDRYDTLKAGEIQDENLDFAEIFKPFRNENDPDLYPETDIIELILKCMLYQSQGTFYQASGKSPHKASIKLRSEIAALSDKYIRHYPSLPTTQSVIIHNLAANIERPRRTMPFNQRIEMLQGLTIWPDIDRSEPILLVANRLLYGSYYFWRVVNLVRTTISETQVPRPTSGQESPPGNAAPEPASDPLILHQILPTYISLELPAEGKIGKAELHRASLSMDLRQELRDNRLELLIRSPTNSFVPNELAGMRREIRLRFLQRVGQTLPDQIPCTYRFRDVATIKRDPSRGDWIVDSRNRIWRIVETPEPHGDELRIALYNPEENDIPVDDLTGQDNGQVDATYFWEIDPVKYYLEMLGLYLQHLIFTYSPITTTTRDRFDIHPLLRAHLIKPPLRILPLEVEGGNELNNIQINFAYLLLQLTLHEATESYYHQIIAKSSSVAILNQVQKQARTYYERLVNLLGIDDYVEEDHPQLMLDRNALPEAFTKMVTEMIAGPNRFDIEETILKIGLIEEVR